MSSQCGGSLLLCLHILSIPRPLPPSSPAIVVCECTRRETGSCRLPVPPPPQGVEAAGERESGGGQPGPTKAPFRPGGSGGGCATETWEAEDGLSVSSGFFFIKKARGACVADTDAS